MSEQSFSVSVKVLEHYVFQVDFGDFGRIITDEDAPLGTGEGPNPARMLAASVVNCLTASLLFAIRKYKGDPGEVTATIKGSVTRVDKRMRIESLDATLQLDADPALLPELDKALAQFENFCTVTQSVRAGIEVKVSVVDKSGKVLHSDQQ